MTDCAPNEQADIISTSIPLLHQCKYMWRTWTIRCYLHVNSCVYASSLPAPALCFLSSDLPLIHFLHPRHHLAAFKFESSVKSALRIVRKCSLCFILPRFIDYTRTRLLWQLRAAEALETSSPSRRHHAVPSLLAAATSRIARVHPATRTGRTDASPLHLHHLDHVRRSKTCRLYHYRLWGTRLERQWEERSRHQKKEQINSWLFTLCYIVLYFCII
jgi:hypothetical protein